MGSETKAELAAMLRMKQDDWIEACQENDRLQGRLDEAVRLLERLDNPREGLNASEVRAFLDSLPAPTPPAGECGTCGDTLDPVERMPDCVRDVVCPECVPRDGGEGGEG